MATRKTKRYDDGGMTDEDVKSFAGTPENESTAGMREAYQPTKAEETSTPAAKKPSFKEAFASARKAGDKTFQFEGKKFTTEMAGEKKAAKVSDTGDETSRLATRAKKPELKYQSLQDRARGYEAERAKSGVGMYGSTKREREERTALPLKSTKSESGYSGMGAMKFSKGGSTASRRADGIATKGKTRGKMY
jgi:hypothetical protein